MKNLSETGNIELLARFDFLDLCLLGETGTGKTHTAQLIHDLSPRAGQPFVAVNCAELCPSLIESELLGCDKGAFTGAVADKAGKFEAADSGTLFLDEIGEIPTNIQAKLLKVVEEKCVVRVGGTRPRRLNLRIIYATNRDLSILREDLRYRITSHTIHLKPLRECTEEIVPMARLFLLEFSRRCGRTFKAADATLKLLEVSEWRGNVRELCSFVERWCMEALFAAEHEQNTQKEIELTHHLLPAKLPVLKKQQSTSVFSTADKFPLFVPGEKMEEYLERIETHLLKTALDAHNNNQTRAAKHLGISRTGLIKKLKRIGH